MSEDIQKSDRAIDTENVEPQIEIDAIEESGNVSPEREDPEGETDVVFAEQDESGADTLGEDGQYDGIGLVQTPMPPTSAVDLMEFRISELEALVPEQEKHVENCSKAVLVRRNRLKTNREKFSEIEVSMGNLSVARDSLATWLQERSQSLAYRLLDHLEHQGALLRAEEIRIRQWAENPVTNIADSAAKLRRRFVIGLWLSVLFAVLIPMGTYYLGRWLVEGNSEFPILGDIWWKHTLFGVALLVLFVLMALLAYFRGYNRMKVFMDRSLTEGRYLSSAINHIRRERARLDSLAPQVKDRLKFFGAVLQEPWRVPSYGSSVGDSSELKKGLPALLQIAKTSHAEDPALVRLRNQFLAEEYKVGMRRQAVGELLRAAAMEQGIAVERAELSEIDRDSTIFGLRSALFETIRNESVLEKIGKEKVAEIAARIQGGMVPSRERPSISMININVFQGLQVNHDLFSDWRKTQVSWDEYVSEILEDGAALSKLAFSALGTTSSKYLHFDSIAVAPDRLRTDKMTYLQFADIGNETVTGTEIVSRIDITPPMDVDQVALFQNFMNEIPENDATARPIILPEPDGTL